MTRTDRTRPNSHKSSGTGTANECQRSTNISRAISKLLRHQAQNERIPITAQGWIKVSDLLAWRGLKDARLFNSVVTLEDIIDVVSHDGKYGKGRFGLRLVEGKISKKAPDDSVKMVHKASCLSLGTTGNHTTAEVDSNDTKNAAAAETPSHLPAEIANVTKNNAETETVIEFSRMHATDASDYLIRANQGHSIRSVESEGLLVSITLDEPHTIPDTVVHGTFYGAWDLIRRSGGLKPMGRNMVHFATGPALSDVVPDSTNPDSRPSQGKIKLRDLLNENKVASGMRHDAQILIYIDLKRCLEDVSTRSLVMNWYRSENGVVLTKGVITSKQADESGILDETTSSAPSTTETRIRDITNLVPIEYFQAVVEINEGIGVLWRHGIGNVRDLSDRLRSKPLPHGKRGQHQSQSAVRSTRNSPRKSLEAARSEITGSIESPTTD